MSDWDSIVIRGIRARGHHGVLPEERTAGQTFVVDATLAVDTTTAAISDDLSDTIDYADVAQRLVAIVEGEPVNLIETLAARLADACFEDKRVQRAEITVHKPEAPVGVPFDDVAVTITRERS